MYCRKKKSGKLREGVPEGNQPFQMTGASGTVDIEVEAIPKRHMCRLRFDAQRPVQVRYQHLSSLLLELHKDTYSTCYRYFVISHFSCLPIQSSAYLNGGVGANQNPTHAQARKSHGMLHS